MRPCESPESVPHRAKSVPSGEIGGAAHSAAGREGYGRLLPRSEVDEPDALLRRLGRVRVVREDRGYNRLAPVRGEGAGPDLAALDGKTPGRLAGSEIDEGETVVPVASEKERPPIFRDRAEQSGPRGRADDFVAEYRLRLPARDVEEED